MLKDDKNQDKLHTLAKQYQLVVALFCLILLIILFIPLIYK